jgi:hypothetical protein
VKRGSYKDAVRGARRAAEWEAATKAATKADLVAFIEATVFLVATAPDYARRLRRLTLHNAWLRASDRHHAAMSRTLDALTRSMEATKTGDYPEIAAAHKARDKAFAAEAKAEKASERAYAALRAFDDEVAL